jgi:hypothetical protein
MSTIQQAKNPTKTRPGLKMGQANEYFLMTPITPEGAKRLRKVLADGPHRQRHPGHIRFHV